MKRAMEEFIEPQAFLLIDLKSLQMPKGPI